MEYMATGAAHFDFDRFGAGILRYSPRQSDVLFVVGTITHKMAPVLRTVYEQMTEPKWVVAFGACAVSGGIYDNYSVAQGIDEIIPVDILHPWLPTEARDSLGCFSQTSRKNTEARTRMEMEEKKIRAINH